MLAWSELRDGRSRITCPECGRGPLDKTMGVTVSSTQGIAHCFRCEYVEHKDGGYIPGTAQTAVDAVKYEGLSDYWRSLWSDCEAIHGTSAAYLTARSCVLPPRDGDLHCHPFLKHPGGYSGPALIGLITDVLTGEPISLQRIWVMADGEKATKPAKLYAKDHRKQDGVIRLWPDEAVTTGLAIAEGIETALSLAHAFTPVWACLDAGNLAAFPVLPGIESLTIGADNDQAGRHAADTCARRWIAAGREVRVVMAPDEGADLNDMAVAA